MWNNNIKIWILVLMMAVSGISCKVFHETKTDHTRYDLNSTTGISSDTEIDDLIHPYKQQLDVKMNKVIGVAEKELVKESPESTLGNWAADAILTQCNLVYKEPIDFAVVNYGGIRIPSLPKGNITTGKVFELMPFDNIMVVLEVDGKVVQQLFELIAQKGGWPVSQGVKCSFTKEGKLNSVSINGEALDNNKIYTVGLTDYVANGGDNCSFFKDQTLYDTGVLFRDAFLQQVKMLTAKGQSIDADVEGRMIISE
ncbi:MAG: 2',3'-cyclic-nucleotide 2'-phosphodiesterase (5'-nucleotidase family) [Maribacter sp.]|jgi:2',3'-cyclic-nucleotide 2'-phosphodiesterase (5'-nucleotidase family)